ncbi:MAG: Pyrimidine 5-nucleotidase YjjG [Pseudomonadota bacterium]|jgi:putative hydrolase of the HAD superfamily
MRSAEQALAHWLGEHAPATARQFDLETRTRIRAGVITDHPERAHDLSFVREEMLRRALHAAGDAPALAPDAFAVFIQARCQVTPYPEVVQVLSRWASRYALVAVSNGNADVMQTELGRFFRGAVNPERIGYPKPDARIFLSACEIAAVDPHDALHIGDDPDADLIGARRAGLQGAWLLRSEHAHRHEAQAYADWHPEPYRDLSEIDQALIALA